MLNGRFQPGEGPSRGLLRDYEPSDGTFWSTSGHRQPRNLPVMAGVQQTVKCRVDVNLEKLQTFANLNHLHLI